MTDSQQRNILIIIFIVFLTILSSVYIVKEGNRAFIIRLGDILKYDGKPIIFEPGIHFKFPFIDTPKIIDIRLQSFEEPSSRILTSEQNYIVIVDYYVKWRVIDPDTYFIRTGGQPQVAENLIQQKINDTLRAEFGRKKITDVITSERSNIMEFMKQVTNKRAKEIGIEVVDVRIKKIDLPEEVSTSVFENMRADRKRVATKHRSDGLAMADFIKAEADKEASVIIATSRKDGAKIKANGDSVANKTFLNAYSKNKKLFKLIRSIEAYQKSFKSNDLFVLGNDSEFFKTMHGEVRKK